MIKTNSAPLEYSMYNSQAQRSEASSEKNAIAHTENGQTALLGNDVAAVYIKSNSMDNMITTYTSSATRSATSPTLKVGSSGTAVKTLQSNLKTLGYYTSSVDGIFGNDTKNAVISFQKAYGLTADGIVGSATQTAITKAIENKNKGLLTVGSRGSDVKTLQTNLKKLGYLSDTADGIFGNNTKNAVMAFQRAQGLTVDGIVGSATQKAIAKAISNIGNVPSTPTTDGVPQFLGHDDLGYLSAKFEAHGECGTISTGIGDSGGKSYGLYQFASKAGTPKDFVNWLKNEDTTFYNKLNDAYNKDGGYGANFDAAWKSLAASDTDRFSELQYNYTKEKYYDSSVKKIKENLNFDVTTRGYALNAVIWSRGVQMGGCGTIFTRAVAGMDLSKASDEEIIRAIYRENAKVTSTAPYDNSNIIKASDGDKYGITGKYLYYFSRNSSNVQAGVYNRLANTELNEALELLRKFG